MVTRARSLVSGWHSIGPGAPVGQQTVHDPRHRRTGGSRAGGAQTDDLVADLDVAGPAAILVPAAGERRQHPVTVVDIAVTQPGDLGEHLLVGWPACRTSRDARSLS
jgi:hypothetical protein